MSGSGGNDSGIVDTAAEGGGSSTGPGSGIDPAGSGPGLSAEPGLDTDPDSVEPGRMQGQESPPSANQLRTEPIPPSEGQDVATAGEHRADEGAGTSTGPGPRMGAQDAHPPSSVSGPPETQPFGAVSSGSAGSTEESGDTHEVNVASGTSAEGTSEAMDPVDGVRLTAIAPEGHADGETDTRVPPTTSF